jgi:hypothetical protein
MDFWFTTSHGDTRHNQPRTHNYVHGEPPIYPRTAINYREKCLRDGFARIGYPNTGDLRNNYINRLASLGYSYYDLEDTTQIQLRSFAEIKAGDFVVIPADEDMYEIHLGMVLTKERRIVRPYINPKPNSYYFYFDIEKGDYYECAHRVNVQWAKDENDNFSIYSIPEIGGVWRQAFSHLHKASERLQQLTKKAGFW